MVREINSIPVLCRSGCGFFGNPATDGLCSICYKASLIPDISPAVTHSPYDSSKDTEGEATGSSSTVAKIQVLDETQDKEKKDPKKKKNRCAMCRKKVGLTGIECRCGGLYCGVHRYSDRHDCSFDYRELGAQEIRRNNPVVAGEKIQKI